MRSLEAGAILGGERDARRPRATMAMSARAIMHLLSALVAHCFRLELTPESIGKALTLQQLTYFLAAADHGSFSAAAECPAHGPAEPVRADPPAGGRARRAAVRRAPAAGSSLTEAGRLLQPARRAHAGRGAGRASSPCARCASSPAAPSPSASSAGAHHYLIGGLVQDFRAGYPGVRVRVVGQNSRRGRRRRARRRRSRPGLVVAAGRRRRAGRARRSRARSCSTSPPTRAASREPVTIEQLADAPLILYDARWAADGPDPPPAARARPARPGVRLEPRDRGRVL